MTNSPPVGVPCRARITTAATSNAKTIEVSGTATRVRVRSTVRLNLGRTRSPKNKAKPPVKYAKNAANPSPEPS